MAVLTNWQKQDTFLLLKIREKREKTLKFTALKQHFALFH